MILAMGHGTCIAEAASGGVCPSDPLAFAVFHLSALSFFSTAIFSQSFLLALLFLGLTAIIARAVIVPTAPTPVLVSARHRGTRHNFQVQREQRSWLSILEKRDPA